MLLADVIGYRVVILIPKNTDSTTNHSVHGAAKEHNNAWCQHSGDQLQHGPPGYSQVFRPTHGVYSYSEQSRDYVYVYHSIVFLYRLMLSCVCNCLVVFVYELHIVV